MQVGLDLGQVAVVIPLDEREIGDQGHYLNDFHGYLRLKSRAPAADQRNRDGQAPGGYRELTFGL